MANTWFRLYSEFAYDPKVQILSEIMQRRYLMILCLNCDGKFEGKPLEEVALALRVTVEDLRVTVDEFKKRGLVTEDGKVAGWNKRQYISDVKDSTAAERMKRYRERKRNAVTQRPPDTDTDSDTDKNPKTSNDVLGAGDKPAKKARVSNRMPYSGDTPPADWGNWALTELKAPKTRIVEQWILFRDYWTIGKGKTTQRSPEGWDTTWRNWCRKEFDGDKKQSAPAKNTGQGALIV